MITELADPNNAAGARYVELYSVSGQNLTGLRLARWTTGNAEYSQASVVDLSGFNIGAGGFLIVCANRATFEATFASASCDLEAGTGGPADSNGDC